MGEMIRFGIKMATSLIAVAAVIAVFATFIGIISAIQFTGPIGEAWSLIGMFMPWNANGFNSIFAAFGAFIALKVGVFVWRLIAVWQIGLG